MQINNPDMRVQILKDYVKQHFPATPLLDYALEVEKITTSKVKGASTELLWALILIGGRVAGAFSVQCFIKCCLG